MEPTSLILEPTTPEYPTPIEIDRCENADIDGGLNEGCDVSNDYDDTWGEDMVTDEGDVADDDGDVADDDGDVADDEGDGSDNEGVDGEDIDKNVANEDAEIEEIAENVQTEKTEIEVDAEVEDNVNMIDGDEVNGDKKDKAEDDDKDKVPSIDVDNDTSKDDICPKAAITNWKAEIVYCLLLLIFLLVCSYFLWLYIISFFIDVQQNYDYYYKYYLLMYTYTLLYFICKLIFVPEVLFFSE